MKCFDDGYRQDLLALDPLDLLQPGHLQRLSRSTRDLTRRSRVVRGNEDRMRARADGDGKNLGRAREKEKDRVAGRFLQSLEQSVRCAWVHRLRAIEDEDFGSPLEGAERRVADDSARLVDGDSGLLLA